jgi:hypothetical protein
MKKYLLTTLFTYLFKVALTANQTPTVSPIFPGDELPFTISIETADFALPNGIHSGVTAIYNGKWLLFAGRTNGMHGFDPGNNNFPPSEQNTTVYVVDPVNETVVTRSLLDPDSGLTQAQIDLLSVTSPQSYQDKDMLYITGGYGVDTASGEFSTKNALTAVNIPKLIRWVEEPSSNLIASHYIRSIFDSLFQVTGGYMTKGANGITLLIFGQNFQGFYSTSSNGVYIEQVRRFYIEDDGKHLNFARDDSYPEMQDPNYRRRDLNIVPIVLSEYGSLKKSFVALSGVFTLDGGIWTVPVFITKNGRTCMRDPSLEDTFKQGMNNYASATVGLFSKKTKLSYTVLLGAISFGFFQNGTFLTDSEFPFINQVTTVQIDSCKNCKQYLMNTEYPVILSTGSNPGNQLLFGAGAKFIPANNVPFYKNSVIKFDGLKRKKQLIGYIVGGIASTLPNTNNRSDSTASWYIFKVYIQRK